MNLKNAWTIKETVYRFDLSQNTVKDTLAKRRETSKFMVEKLESEGYIKYFKTPESTRGDWILTPYAAAELFNGITFDKNSLHDEDAKIDYDLLQDICYERVENAILDQNYNGTDTFALACAFCQSYDNQYIKQVVNDQYLARIEEAETLDYSVKEFLYDSLEANDNMRNADYYENEDEANADNYYWNDDLGKWLYFK